MAEEKKNLSPDEAEKKRQELRDRLDNSRHTIEHGKMILMTPLTYRDEEVNTIEYDFSGLTSYDIMDALDSDKNNRDNSGLSNRQAFALFAVAVGKADQDIDANDIKEQMGADDCITAIRVARAFFNLSAQRGALSISEV